MSRFNTRRARATPSAPVTTTGARTTTYEGGAAYVRDARSDLFLLSVVNMVGQDTFYEKAGDRDARFRDLVRQLAVEDPEWTAGLLGWLRGSANMRSAAVVGAAEFVKARLDAGLSGRSRQIVASVLQRPDEPGELLGYWAQQYGRGLPKPVKRGVADAVQRLYNGKALLKYDTASKGYRFADVLNLVHAAPAADKPWQGELFQYALDRRHNPDTAVPPASNRTLTAHRALMALPVEERRAVVTAPAGTERLAAAGMTWEALAGWLQGPMDAAAWEAVIPSMGLMALTRNLRNFDEAGVSDETAALVARRLADPEEVRRSRQFPYRFLSAYRAAPSLRWGHALEQALTAATGNIPDLPGRTLVLVDTSGSMEGVVSARSTVRHVDVGALFGVALAARGSEVDLYGFADGVFHHPLTKGGSVLRQTESFCARIGEVGHGTETVAALKTAFKGHDRVVIVSDMQAFAYPGSGARGGYAWGPRGYGRRNLSVSEAVPADVPLFGINTTGYAQASLDTGEPNRYEIGGFSDQLFTMVDLLSRGRDAGWPWEG
ncbi:TROVE domain-containing protein [Streptomyces yaanensis]|uniref:TROVE domain-containing protein n=1 Tax=Streptomyces yaanensis TaxID=1142239 RepID=A0ABV7S9U9_9ACTN|nr:TROVE domain-containing protein [Streptomyces sp. CGMCC 4.7035]WNC00133.1 TROVE domain-containing protein [Streptomyces sp. CGMCC 4.7035]